MYLPYNSWIGLNCVVHGHRDTHFKTVETYTCEYHA